MMRRYLFLLIVLAVLAGCSANRYTDETGKQPCNDIDLQKAVDQARAADKAFLDKAMADMNTYRENVFLAIGDLEKLRKEMENLNDRFLITDKQREAMKNMVSDEQKDSMVYLKDIEYKEKMEEVKNRIADIEKFMRENCYGYQPK
jgi:hypothetical protein